MPHMPSTAPQHPDPQAAIDAMQAATQEMRDTVAILTASMAHQASVAETLPALADASGVDALEIVNLATWPLEEDEARETRRALSSPITMLLPQTAKGLRELLGNVSDDISPAESAETVEAIGQYRQHSTEILRTLLDVVLHEANKATMYLDKEKTTPAGSHAEERFKTLTTLTVCSDLHTAFELAIEAIDRRADAARYVATRGTIPTSGQG